MHKEKKAKLERAGWKVGSVADFLGLSAAEEALVELRLTLSRGRSATCFRPPERQCYFNSMISSCNVVLPTFSPACIVGEPNDT